jgi:hypothetical protein
MWWTTRSGGGGYAVGAYTRTHPAMCADAVPCAPDTIIGLVKCRTATACCLPPVVTVQACVLVTTHAMAMACATVPESVRPASKGEAPHHARVSLNLLIPGFTP